MDTINKVVGGGQDKQQSNAPAANSDGGEQQDYGDKGKISLPSFLPFLLSFFLSFFLSYFLPLLHLLVNRRKQAS